jgi:hypothetical protein
MRTWSARRSRLNHDLIRNRLLPALGAMGNIVRGHIASPVESVLGPILETWEQVRTETEYLMNSFIQEMSPEILLDEAPLCFCSSETLSWLRIFLRSRWLRTFPVERCLVDLKEAVELACISICELRVIMQGQQSMIGNSIAVIERIDLARSALQDLSKCLSAFPSRVIL